MTVSTITALPSRVLCDGEAPTPAVGVARNMVEHLLDCAEDLQWECSTLSQSTDLTPAVEALALDLLESFRRTQQLAAALVTVAVAG